MSTIKASGFEREWQLLLIDLGKRLGGATTDRVGKWGQGPFIKVPVVWFHMMTPDEAILLAYLWNFRNILGTSGELEKGGWFYCTNRRICRYLRWSSKVQNRVFRLLEKRRFVTREIRVVRTNRSRGVRYVRVNRRRIMKAAYAKMGLKWVDTD